MEPHDGDIFVYTKTIASNSKHLKIFIGLTLVKNVTKTLPKTLNHEKYTSSH